MVDDVLQPLILPIMELSCMCPDLSKCEGLFGGVSFLKYDSCINTKRHFGFNKSQTKIH